jgi:hypothetical protein
MTNRSWCTVNSLDSIARTSNRTFGSDDTLIIIETSIVNDGCVGACIYGSVAIIIGTDLTIITGRRNTGNACTSTTRLLAITVDGINTSNDLSIIVSVITFLGCGITMFFVAWQISTI